MQYYINKTTFIALSLFLCLLHIYVIGIFDVYIKHAKICNLGTDYFIIKMIDQISQCIIIYKILTKVLKIINFKL